MAMMTIDARVHSCLKRFARIFKNIVKHMPCHNIITVPNYYGIQAIIVVGAAS